MEIFTAYFLFCYPRSSLSFKQKQPNIQNIHTFDSLKKGWRMECYEETDMGFIFFWPGIFAGMMGGFVGIIAIMWCLFKCLGNHCDGNSQDDAEDPPPPYSSLFVIKQEDPPPPYSSLFGVKEEDPPPPYPGTHKKTYSEWIINGD